MEIITYSSTGVYEVLTLVDWTLLFGSLAKNTGGGGWKIPLNWGDLRTSVFIYLKDAQVVFDADETSVDVMICNEKEISGMSSLKNRCSEILKRFEMETPGFPRPHIPMESTIQPLLIQPNPDFQPRLRLRFLRERPPFTTSDDTFCESSGGRGGRIPFTGVKRGGRITGRARIQNIWISVDGSKANINVTLEAAQYKPPSGMSSLRPKGFLDKCILFDD